VVFGSVPVKKRVKGVYHMYFNIFQSFIYYQVPRIRRKTVFCVSWKVALKQIATYNTQEARWYIHLEQTIYHLCRPIIIPSGWWSSPVVEYHRQWLIVYSRINHHRWYLSLSNEYRSHRMNIVCSRWILSPSDEYHLI
jgi:hypothetical protein